MKLCECKHGVLVILKGYGTKDKIGMVVGITNYCESGDLNTRSNPFRAIPLVQWADGQTHGVHHSTLEIFEDF